jgi:CubicO group peptidase (beta-lactamase class C family)
MDFFRRTRALLVLSTLSAVLALGALVAPTRAVSPPPQEVYFPGPGDLWEKRSPEQVGLNGRLLDQAIAFAKASETKDSRDLGQNLSLRTGEPFSELIGPVKERGEMSGVVVRRGYLVAEWGEPERVDMTFSVTKSFLSTTVGLAFDRGLIRSVHDRVQPYVPLEHFNSEHNRKITWDHLLRQTSDWEGTLWGKPDWADRPSGDPSGWLTRKRNEPGASYKYNDVRVNVLAYAALNVWRRPLPQVLKELVMDPIGASNTWRWYGYENSWVNVDGVMMQSVSGGGHWGGGMWISARDQARFGYLTLRRGRWKDRQILSEKWIEMATTPTPVEPTYGFMNFFLNTDRKLLASAPAKAFCHLGAGSNMIYVDPENDLVVVARWIDRPAMDGFIQRVLAALAATSDGEANPVER